MWLVYANENDVLHTPDGGDLGTVLINPVLTEKLNAHGSLEFGIAPSNPFYDKLEKRKTFVRVEDTRSGFKWFGRVMSIDRGWNNVKQVFCEGVLGCLMDGLFRPFGFKGSPSELLDALLAAYRGTNTRGPDLFLGNVSVTDPNNTIVRSSESAMPIWTAIDENLFGSSLGGYILARYDDQSGTHYVDYLALDESDQYAKISTQTIRFGQNLLDFSEHSNATDVITYIYPYGAKTGSADPPQPSSGLETWDGNRVTIRSVNSNHLYLRSALGVSLWGAVAGTRVWDDVTVPANLKTKAQAWLDQHIMENVSVEVSAVDLSFVDVAYDQIHIGEYVRCISVPHNLGVLLLCSEKKTYLTALERSVIILGAGELTLTDLQRKEPKNA